MFFFGQSKLNIGHKNPTELDSFGRELWGFYRDKGITALFVENKNHANMFGPRQTPIQ